MPTSYQRHRNRTRRFDEKGSALLMVLWLTGGALRRRAGSGK